MIVLLIFICVTLAHSLTLQEILHLAVERNIESVKSEIDLRKLDERIREVKGSILPTVKLSATYTKWDKNYISSFVPENKYSVSLGLSQSVFDMTLWTALRVARENKELQKILMEDVKQSVMGEVEKLYWAILLKREILRVKRESLDYWQRYYELVEEKYRRGIVPRYEFLRARAQLRQAKADLIRAESDLKSSVNSLKSFLGIRQDLFLEGTLRRSTLKLEEPFALLRERNATLKVLRKTLEVKRANVKLRRADYYPKLSFFFNYNFENIMDFEAGRLKEDYRHGYNFGLRFDLTIFEGAKRGARIVQEKLEERKTLREFEFTKVKLENELETLMSQLRSTEEEIGAREDTLLAAEESLRFATERYKEGVGSQVELLEARQNYERAKISLLNAIYSYNTLIADIKKLLGLYRKNRQETPHP